MTSRFAWLSALLILVAGPAVAAPPLQVVASFSILADMAREVGGDQVQVTALVGPDGDAHVYEPTPADAKLVSRADLLIVNGLGYEGWFDRLFASAAAKAPVVVASTGIRPRTMEEEGEGRVTDPHAWQDLANGRRYVANIAAALARVAPDRAAVFDANARAYDQRLAALDAWVRAELGSIPREQRWAITSHDAFGYFGQAYGVGLLAAVGVSTEAEPTARGVAALVRQMKDEAVRVVFVENMSDPRLVRQIARDAGGQVGGELYADALSPPEGPAPTYEAMFRYNTATLKAGLEANAKPVSR